MQRLFILIALLPHFLTFCESASVNFNSAPSVKNCQLFRTAVTTCIDKADCAVLCSLNDTCRSFSFNNFVCVLSNSPDCAASGATVVFRKQLDSSAVAPADLGYEQQIGDRRFWVFQQRKSGAVSFARNWTEYEQGFGDSVNFWSGLDSINKFTKPGNVTLRVEMITLNRTLFVSEWLNFTVSDVSTNYTMKYSQYIRDRSSLNGDCLAHHNGMQFSTYDRDNDKASSACSDTHGSSGFWFNSCVSMTPNGLYSTVDMRQAAYMSCIEIYIPIVGEAYSTLGEMRMMLQYL